MKIGKRIYTCIVCFLIMFSFSACSVVTDMASGDSIDSGSDSTPSAAAPEVNQEKESEIMEFGSSHDYEYERTEIMVESNGRDLYGVAYIPITDGAKVPLVIYSHGLGGSYSNGTAYAEQLASSGIATYCFDFYGGSAGSRSGGSTTEMSVMTEVSDLEFVLEAAGTWDFVDRDKIILLGSSQGGVVSAITAARHEDKIAGMVLLYPAFVITDAVYGQFDSLEEIPDTYSLGWITAGRIYLEDIWNYDAYSEIGNYKKPVMLLHGDEDAIVDVSYSEKAVEVYENAGLFIINGAGHGFSGGHFEEVMVHIFNYLEEIEVLTVTN